MYGPRDSEYICHIFNSKNISKYIASELKKGIEQCYWCIGETSKALIKEIYQASKTEQRLINSFKPGEKNYKIFMEKSGIDKRSILSCMEYFIICEDKKIARAIEEKSQTTRGLFTSCSFKQCLNDFSE